MPYSVDTIRKITDDDTNTYHIEVGPDPDGLGCIDISQFGLKKQLDARLTLAPDVALAVANAIHKCHDELIK